MDDTKFVRIINFGNGPVAEFASFFDGNFCLDECNLRERISNVKKSKRSANIEEEALRAILKAKESTND